jgi:hypothetical protein
MAKETNIKLFDNKQVRTTWSEAEEKRYFRGRRCCRHFGRQLRP